MKIDLLHYAAPPVVGGVETVIGHHARLMTNAGHQVRILAGRGAQFDERIPFVLIPKADSRHEEIQEVKNQLDQGLVTSRFHSLVEELVATLTETLQGTQVLIAHNVCSLNKNLPLTAALKQIHDTNHSLRLILWHHDLAWTTPRYQAELHPGFPWDLLRRDWSATTQVVVSRLRQQELAALIETPPDRIRVIPNGLDLERFLKLEPQTLTFIQQLNLLTAEPLLLLPVRITPRKNIELALKVLTHLCSIFPKARLVVTGPLGPHNPANVDYFDRLWALRAELDLVTAAHFLAEHTPEFLPDSVIADFYRLADALLLPSREEGFGIPLLEAGLAGIPCFCTDIPPLRDLGGDQAHYFSPDADPVAVAQLITRELSQSATYQLRQTVRTRYTWERVYADHIDPLLAA